MIRTTLEEFRRALLAEGRYVTAPDHRAKKLRRPGWWTTLSFSWAPFSVFPRCAISSGLNLLTVDKWAHFCFECVRKAEAFGMDVTVEGWKRREEVAGPVVYVANHMSTLETILLPPILLTYGPLSVVAKQSLSHLPCLEKAAYDMGLIPLGRKSPREDLMTMLTVGVERLKAGSSMLVFSQGSREPVFARKGFSSIGAKLAEKAGVPVVPVAVKTDCEPTRPDGKGWFKDFGTVDPSRPIKVECGPACTGPAREMHAASFAWLKAKLDEWGLPTQA